MKKKTNAVVTSSDSGDGRVTLNLNDIRCIKNRPLSDDDIAGMATSIGNAGLINPITLRRLDPPIDDKRFDVLAGRCRYFALLLLKRYDLASDDYRIIETQDPELISFVENFERRELTIMEEVEHLAGLAKTNDYADIAKMIGRTEKYVRVRMNLNNLNDHFKNAMADEKYPMLKVGHYEIISRYPGNIQKQLENDWRLQGRVGSVEDFSAMLNTNFVHQLATAPFSLKATPDCTICLKRSLAQPWLFEELKKKENDCCLDSECWAKKKNEKIATDLEAIRKGEFKGVDVKPNEPLKIISTAYHVEPKSMPKGIAILPRSDYEIVKNKNAKPNAYIAHGDGAGTLVHIRVNDKPTPMMGKAAGPKTVEEKLEQLQKRRLKLAIEKFEHYLDASLVVPDPDDAEPNENTEPPPPPLPFRPSPDMVIKLVSLCGIGPDYEHDGIKSRNVIELEKALDWCWREILEQISGELCAIGNNNLENINDTLAREACDLCGIDWQKFLNEADAEIPMPKSLIMAEVNK